MLGKWMSTPLKLLNWCVGACDLMINAIAVHWIQAPVYMHWCPCACNAVIAHVPSYLGSISATVLSFSCLCDASRVGKLNGSQLSRSGSWPASWPLSGAEHLLFDSSFYDVAFLFLNFAPQLTKPPPSGDWSIFSGCYSTSDATSCKERACCSAGSLSHCCRAPETDTVYGTAGRGVCAAFVSNMFVTGLLFVVVCQTMIAVDSVLTFSWHGFVT